METQQPIQTTTTQVVQQAVVVQQVVDPYTLFPSPTNNFEMKSIGSEDELKCLFCVPINLTFQVLRISIGILILLIGIGIIVLTIDIFSENNNFSGITPGEIWILTVSLIVGYLILKIYTFYRCNKFLKLYKNGPVQFHDNGRLFFYAFGM